MQAAPKNRIQGIIFGILMSVTMAYGMEVYNVAWKMGFPTLPGGLLDHDQRGLSGGTI